MALRTSKITSEFIHTCNKFFSSTSEATIKSKSPATPNSESTRSQPFRYKIANTEKPQGLPELNFHDENAPLFAELQPSANPEFRFENHPTKWAEKITDNSPFPPSIKMKSRSNVIYSDLQKAEDKFVKCKMTNFVPTNRQFSTTSRFYSRSPADNSGKGNCKQKLGHCVKMKKRKDCKLVAKGCPHLKIDNCKQSKGSRCELRYLDPHCHKKQAPYPSYSEACAENLPDDPSECQQCPWRTCDGADTIEPGKPVRHRRNYSTSCDRYLESMGGVVRGPDLPPPLYEIQEYMSGKCGNVKKPCKHPIGPCEKRKLQEKKHRTNKKHEHDHHGSKKKKASDSNDRMVLSNVKEVGEDTSNKPHYGEQLRLIDENSTVQNDTDWIDTIEASKIYLNPEKKYPNCPQNIKPTKQAPKPKNIFLAGPEMLLKKGGKKRIKGDEGHPPPCPEPKGRSKRCPTKPLKKPKYKKRPMDESFYKDPEEPYTKPQ